MWCGVVHCCEWSRDRVGWCGHRDRTCVLTCQYARSYLMVFLWSFGRSVGRSVPSFPYIYLPSCNSLQCPHLIYLFSLCSVLFFTLLSLLLLLLLLLYLLMLYLMLVKNNLNSFNWQYWKKILVDSLFKKKLARTWFAVRTIALQIEVRLHGDEEIDR